MANWQETYEQLKKRKKQVDKVKNTSEIKQIDKNIQNNKIGRLPLPSYTNENKQLPPLPTLNRLDTTGMEPIKKKEEKRTWFTSGAFADGYDFGDITKTILGTTEDLKTNVKAGVLGLAEKTIDAGAFLAGGTAKLFGNDKFADKTKKFVEKDLIDEEKLARIDASTIGSDIGRAIGESITNKDLPTKESINKILFDNTYEDNSILGEKSDSLAQSAGQLVATYGLQMAGIPWWLTTGTTSFGGEVEQAFKKDATYGEAGFSGLVSAGAEILTEKISGGISFGGKTLDKGLTKAISEKISNKALGKLLQFGIDATGEGLEEVATEFISTVGQQLSYEREETWNELLNNEEAMDKYLDQVGESLFGEEARENYKEAFIGGAVLGGASNVIGNVGQDVTPVQQDIAPVNETIQTQQQAKTQETVEDIDNQIAELEEKLMNTEDDAEYERLSKQISELEDRANQLENGTVQQDIAPVQMASVEQTQQPTTQEVESNLPTDVVSNTQNIETNNSSIVENGNSIYNKSNKEVVLDEKGIDGVGTRTTVDGSNVQEVNETISEREYTTREWEEFERRATETRKTELSEYEQQLSSDIKNNFNKEVVFFNDKNSKYQGGASVNQKDAIYVLSGENVSDRTENFVAYHEVLESEILHNKNLKSKYIDVAIDEIINDEGFQKARESFIDGQENLKNASDRLIAKDIIVDIFAEQQTGINKGYDLNLSDTTLEVIDYNLQAFTNEAKNKRNTEPKQNAERTTPTQEELDNLEYTRKNKSGSEYASEYYALGNKYGTTNLYKALNNYKSTGKALSEDIAPIRQELAETTKELVKTIKDTTKEVTKLKKELNEVKESVSEIVEEGKALTEADLPMVEQEALNNMKSATDDMAPVIEDTTPEYEFENDNEGNQTKTLDPMADRTLEDVGNRKVKAYQYENPEFKPYFQEMARYMLSDLNYSQKGQRTIIGDISQTGGGNYEFSGQKRHTTPDIAGLLDSQYNYTYADIEKGLKAIIEDHGAENTAIAKRIEFALNDRLLNGYTDIDGYQIPPNQDYIRMLQEKEYNDYYNSIPIDDIAPYEATSEEVSNTDIAPVLTVSPKMEQKTTSKNVDWETLEDTSKGEQQSLKVNKLGETLTPNKKDLGTLEDTSKGNQQQFNTESEQIEDSIEKKTKKQIKQELLQKTGIMNESLDNANKLPKILMENTDPIRLQEMVFGRSLGNDINKMFFQKVKDNTSEKIRFQNKERAEIKALGIKARSKESSAVQKYGEKQWTNETTGEVLPYGDKELASEFPNVETQKKIKRASKIIRQKYDSYLDQTNKVLTELGYDAIPKRKDYMRHFQELNDIFSRVGIPYNYNEMTANDLPTDINGLTADFSPSKNFFASTLQRKGTKTTYDAITGIDGYLEGVGNLIYHTEDIQRLRAYEQYIRDTYGENHGFDNLETLTDEEKATRIEKIQDNHLSNYASWLHEYTNTLAGKKALIDRSIESLVGRKIYSFLNIAKTQVGRNMIGFNISSAMTNAIAGVQTLAKTNKLATVKGLADTIKNTFSKDGFVEKNNFLTSRFGSDMLSKNLWQRIGDAGFVFMQGTDYFVSNFVVRSKYNELKAKGYTDQQAHVEAGKYASRLMSDRSQGATPNIYNSQMLGVLIQFQNEVNNQVYSMFYDTYHESKEKAQGNALKTAAGMTFTLGQLAVFTHLFGAGFEAMAGYNPTFDIISMLMKAFGLDDEEDSEDTTKDNISQAFEQLGKALPYISIFTGGRVPISEALPVEQLFTGKDEYGNEKSRWETFKEALPYHVLPTGYSQYKKTTKGLGMYDEDLPIAGSYTDSGNLRFTVEDDTWSKIQAGIFGQWANDEAQTYVDSEFKTINKDNIDELIDLGMTSSEYRKYRTGLSAQKKVEDKIEYINDLDVTDEQKTIMANNVLKRDYDVDMGKYDNFGSYEEFDYSYKNPEKYEWLQSEGISYEEYSASDESKELYNYAYKYPETYKLGKAITGDFATYKEHADYIWDLKADKDENGDSISGTKKTKVIEYVNSLDLSIPQKAMLIRKTYSSFDEYNYDIVDYVDNLDMEYDDKVSILKSLDMEVDDEGNINW